jgi:hypothetical protein
MCVHNQFFWTNNMEMELVFLLVLIHLLLIELNLLTMNT